MSVNFSEEDKLDYLAGIVDTEGTIDLHNDSIRLRIGNANKYLIVWLKKEFCANYYPMKKKRGYKQAWKWEVSGGGAYKILKKIEDKLILKNEQLLLVIEFYERITKASFRGRFMPLWAKTFAKEIDAKLKALNKKGVDKTGVLRPDSEIEIKNRLVYLAGCIDGDGTVGISKDKRKTPLGYAHHMSVPSTDQRGLEWIQHHYDGTICTVKAEREGYAKQYEWKISGKNAYKLIKELREHLMLKQEQADAAIKMYEKVTKWNLKPRPAWAVRLQEEMYQKCKELNKTGDNEEETPEEVEIKVVRVNPQKGLASWV